jgi:hypothetical protein
MSVLVTKWPAPRFSSESTYIEFTNGPKLKEVDMTEVAWAAIAVLAATSFGNILYLRARIDSINDRIDAANNRIDASNDRIQSLSSRLDAKTEALAARLDAHSSQVQTHTEHHPS